MDDYISKPVSRKAIQMMLERWGRVTCKTTSNRGGVTVPKSRQSNIELSENALGMLRGLEDDENPGIVQRVMSLFLERTPDQLEALRRAGEVGDTNSIRTASHTLKSASAVIGAMSLSACCAKLETLARDGSVDEAMPLIEDIISEYETIRPSVEVHANRTAESLGV
jgi:HPt (histidine-containing phosphotransfer) domain-containing protein